MNRDLVFGTRDASARQLGTTYAIIDFIPLKPSQPMSYLKQANKCQR